MKEQQFQKKVQEYIKSIGGYVRKINNANMTGTPDLIACIQSLFFAFECKKEEEPGTALQQYNIRLIREAGGSADVVWTLDQVKEIIKQKLSTQQNKGVTQCQI